MKQPIQAPPQIKHWIDRLFQSNRLAHAYLFVGPKGAGKMQAALYYAQAIFCPNKTQDQPCYQCTECTRIMNRNHPDVHWVTPDGASIKIDQVRELQKEFSYRGVEQNKKIYIISHMDTMTVQAANSLLKFLEEPSLGTTAILLTEQKQQLLPTILSRCQEITFPHPSTDRIQQELKDDFGSEIATTASHITADLEEAYALCNADWFADLRKLVIQLIEEVTNPSSEAMFFLEDKGWALIKDKEQTDITIELLLLWYRDLLYTKTKLTEKLVYIDHIETLQRQGKSVSQNRLAKGIEAILKAKKRLNANVNTQLLLEQLVIRLQEG